MSFKLTLTGLNHRTASVDIREKFALTNHCDPDTWLLPHTEQQESLILSTCNRVEVLIADTAGSQDSLLTYWTRESKADLAELSPHIYRYENLDAVKHVFEVASSLDSMVLGEPQILGQLKEAYRKAVDAGRTGIILNRLMHTAFFVAKRVRSETAVASSAVSISYAAVELAKRIFASMQGHKAMLIGAGEMAELASLHLLQAGIDKIYVLNRTLEHGCELAARIGGKALPFEKLEEALEEVDIVISSTGSPTPILNASHLAAVLRKRRNKPMFIIDIAVPRDIDPDVNTLDNIYLYDIDDLKEVVEENMASRQEEAEKARKIIDMEVKRFSHWLETLEVNPTIMEILKRGEQAAHLELAKTLHKMPHLSEQDRHNLELMAMGIVHKLNHAPLIFLKNGNLTPSDIATRIKTVRDVLNLDLPQGHSGQA